MSFTFHGEEMDEIASSNIMSGIGYPLLSLIAIAGFSDEPVTLSTLLQWQSEQKNLDFLVRTISNENVNLESFITQYFCMLKKKYVTENEEKLKDDVRELEICLNRVRVENNRCLKEIIGRKKIGPNIGDWIYWMSRLANPENPKNP